MIDEKKQQLQSLGLPVYRSEPHNQTGNSFGEKISNTIENVFNKGFEKILIVGNDCPLLDTATLRKAIHQLKHSDVVIGPDVRGGIYLLGISKISFCKKDIEQLPWQTSGLAFALQSYFKSIQVAPVVLKTLSDINQPSDLFLIQRRGSKSIIVLHFIFDLLQQTSAVFSRIKDTIKQMALASTGLRAPPLAVL